MQSIVCVFAVSPLLAQSPTVLDAGYSIELVAEHPAIVTPVGLTFDQSGRLLVIESHTHQRPLIYGGPPRDRIRAFTFDDAGKVKSVHTFYEGTTYTMSLATASDGSIFVATRRQIFRLIDDDDDGIAEKREPIANLETEGDYPHNGLSGLVFGPEGDLYFGLGENLGVPYSLSGTDGRSLSGGGEGGSFYRCHADGSSLTRVATGFWNPFGNCFDDQGRLFSVDNDPDASPPCRLVQVVPTGDYGYQFRYGRSGRHPLQTWTGDLPGTLGMVAGTGEAPCEMIAHNGRLWVTSWGDHRIEGYNLQVAAAKVTASRQIIVQGDKDFRPVGLELGPDGAIYFTDWVDRSYPVHGRGRIWRLRPTDKSDQQFAFPKLSDDERRASKLRTLATFADLNDDDPFVRQAAIAGLVGSSRVQETEWSDLHSARERIGFLQVRRWQDPTNIKSLVSQALSDPDNNVRLYGLRIVADEQLTELRPVVVNLLESASDSRTLATVAATIGWLDEGDKSKNTEPLRDRIAAILDDQSKAESVRHAAMKYLPHDDPYFSDDWLERQLAGDGDRRLATEALRILALRGGQQELLLTLASDKNVDSEMRADALSGITNPNFAEAVNELTAKTQPEAVQVEARRVLQHLTNSIRPSDELPQAEDTDAWLNLLGDDDGNPNAGHRVFSRALGTSCIRCHSYDGRGSEIGPDLTQIHSRATKRFLIESILTPAREVAPQYAPIAITTDDGQVFTGIPFSGPAPSGREIFLGPDGKQIDIRTDDIESRQHIATSIMPSGFDASLTVDELRDLIAFLMSKPRSRVGF